MVYFIGVDVGTGSVRVAVVSPDGLIHGISVRPITIWNPIADVYEQSSENIWRSVCEAVKEVMDESMLNKDDIVSIAFDATCSLVVVDKDTNSPVDIAIPPSSFSSVPEVTGLSDVHNIIVWMDHRAKSETELINSINFGKTSVLDYLGGKISIEMEVPKILWLKNNTKPSTFSKMQFFDLPDYLTFKATGINSRSLCSLACKCTYVSPSSTSRLFSGWNNEFLKSIGLDSIVDENFFPIGGPNGKVLKAGEKVGYLSSGAAKDLGLSTDTLVASPLIDAYAGYLGSIGAGLSTKMHEINNAASLLNDSLSKSSLSRALENRIALICGTSSCHIAASSQEIFVSGVWGPYCSVVLPGLNLAEGGQSATGQLIDWVINTHPSYFIAKKEAEERSISILEYLHMLLIDESKKLGLMSVAFLTENMHVLPDVHGNRSPLGDVTLRGMFVGISLDTSVLSLALRYLASIQSLAYGSKHIVDHLNTGGYTINEGFASGGLCHNALFLQIHADVLRFPIHLSSNVRINSRKSDAFLDCTVVVGSAMNAAACTDYFENGLLDAMTRMTNMSKSIYPTTLSSEIEYNSKKYSVMRTMIEDQKKYQKMMGSL